MLQQQIEGKYELLGQLADEGGAEVFKVRHLFLDEIRLIKVVHPPSLAMTEEVTRRFLQEARAAIKLRHPNIAQLHDFSIDEEGTAFIVTEFIAGLNLEEALADAGPPPVELALSIARQALRALGYLHQAGMVHRDVSPEKLVLTQDVEGRALVKWVDLGTAQVLAAGEDFASGAGVFPARPKCASPERFSAGGETAVDARSDLYSFGVVLYELLTGRCPIAGNDPFSLMVGHLSSPPLPFAESDPTGRVPVEVREIVLATLAKKPEQRIATAAELTRRLATLQDPLADDRGDYLERVLRGARQKTAVMIPAVVRAAAAPKPQREAKPEPKLEPKPAPKPAPQAKPAPPLPPPTPPPAPALRFDEPTLPVRPAPRPPQEIWKEPPRSVAPAAGPGSPEASWDQREISYATQALRFDPVLPSEETQRTRLEIPVPSPASPMPPAQAPTTETAALATPPRQPLPKPLIFGLVGAALAALLIGTGWWLGGASRPARPAAEPPAAQAAAPAPAPPIPTIEVGKEPRKPDPKPEPTEEMRQAALAAQAAQAARRAARKAAAEPGGVLPAAESPAGRGRMLTAGPGVEAAEPTDLGEAVYPEQAKGTGKKPRIKVAMLVDENGNVLETRIKEGDPSHLGFNEAAATAARRTRFLPATKDGVPGKMWTELIFDFALAGGAPP